MTMERPPPQAPALVPFLLRLETQAVRWEEVRAGL